MSFPHFSHFCEKVRKVDPFWPKSKNSEKHCRFYHVFMIFPHFCAKVGGEVVLGEMGGEGPGATGNRASGGLPVERRGACVGSGEVGSLWKKYTVERWLRTPPTPTTI